MITGMKFFLKHFSGTVFCSYFHIDTCKLEFICSSFYLLKLKWFCFNFEVPKIEILTTEMESWRPIFSHELAKTSALRPSKITKIAPKLFFRYEKRLATDCIEFWKICGHSNFGNFEFLFKTITSKINYTPHKPLHLDHFSSVFLN